MTSELYEKAVATNVIQKEVEDIVSLVMGRAGLLRRAIMANDDGQSQDSYDAQIIPILMLALAEGGIELLLQTLEGGIEMTRAGATTGATTP